MKRIGIDIGGTFTDIVVFDEDNGAISRWKTPTTPHAPEDGFGQALGLTGVAGRDIRALIHGTTIVTNLILERKGARIALITTRGFRDVLEIMRASRPLPYDLAWRKPRHLIPRELRFEVDERIDAAGAVVTPLQMPEAERIVDMVLATGVDGIAVCLLHAYQNDVHERMIEEVITTKRPELPMSISSRVCREIREYERTSTTAVNVYAMPRVKKYVSALTRQLERPNLVNYLSSEGGLLPPAEAAERPISLCLSGPAGGVLGGSFVSNLIGRRNLITIDMGGTSLDIAVIRDGSSELRSMFEIEWGLPVKAPTIDIKTIGAGGGSIVWVDEGDALRVGPHSAGADPGPACYGKGGTECTVTDANLVLGLVNPGGLLGGAISLDRAAAEVAVGRTADHFEISVLEAAEGIYRVVNANMAAAIRQMTIENGIDPREFALVPFGGAGGQHAVALAREVGVPTVVVPNMPSVFSAFGMISAPIRLSRSRTVMRPLATLTAQSLGEVFESLRLEIKSAIETSGIDYQYGFEYSLDLKYLKQAHEINISTRPGSTRDAIEEAFERKHLDLYATRLGHEILVVTARAAAVSELPPLRPKIFDAVPDGTPEIVRRASVAGVEEPVPVVERNSLEHGMTLSGPWLVDEIDTSLFLPGGSRALIDEYKNLIITV